VAECHDAAISDWGDVTSRDGGRTGRQAVGVVMLGTAVLGLSGLVVLAVTARVLGAADYAVFGVFWSAVFFVVAVLFGAQQESTRSVAQRQRPDGRTSLVFFALLVGAAAAVVVVATSPAWQPSSLAWHAQLVLAVAAGGIGYAMTGVLSGALAGAARWRSYSAMLVVEGVSRVALVVGLLMLADGVTPLAWAVVGAYPATLIAASIMVRRGGISLRVDDSMARLAGNTARTMVAAAAVAALVNGFPLVMSTFARDASESTVGALTLAVMLTRAPLLVPLMALQSLLIKRFSDADDRLTAQVVRLDIACVAVAAVLAAGAAAVGPAIVEVVFGAEFVLPHHVFGALVLSSGLIGAMSVTSPALIARGAHSANALAWVVAAALSIGVLAVAPGGLYARVSVALLLGPLAGSVVQLALLRGRSSVSAAPAGAPGS
jgi:O-antigen/teichoic acid export membrane protein